MPNVARYDYFDGPQEDNTIVEFRALHDIPADTQITQSYFPLSWWACFSHVPVAVAAVAAAAVVAAANVVDACDPSRQAGTALKLPVTALCRVVLIIVGGGGGCCLPLHHMSSRAAAAEWRQHDLQHMVAFLLKLCQAQQTKITLKCVFGSANSVCSRVVTLVCLLQEF